MRVDRPIILAREIVFTELGRISGMGYTTRDEHFNPSVAKSRAESVGNCARTRLGIRAASAAANRNVVATGIKAMHLRIPRSMGLGTVQA
jgi:hypothetical protein